MTSCGHTTQHRENASDFTHPWKPSLNHWVLHLKFESSRFYKSTKIREFRFMPKFSIVIPSARPHLLPSALRSAVEQDFDDYEVIVSDNSGIGGCKIVIESFGSHEIRYVKPPSKLDVTPHWDFAISHALGDWVVLLCDDDALLPCALKILDRYINKNQEVDSIKWQLNAHSRVQNNHRKHTVSMPACRGKVDEYDAKDLLLKMFESGTGLFRVKHTLPFMPLATYRRELIEKVRSKQDGHKFFHPPCPMTSGAFGYLAFANKTLVLDLPLTVIGDPPDSAGNQAMNDEAYKEMHNTVSLEYVPIKSMLLFPSTSAESLLRAREALVDYVPELTLNYPMYFLACALAIKELERMSADVSAVKKMFDQALSEYPKYIQIEFNRLLGKEMNKQQINMTKSKILLSNIKHKVKIIIKSIIGTSMPEYQKWNAEDIHVEDVYDAAIYVNDILKSHSLGAEPNSTY